MKFILSNKEIAKALAAYMQKLPQRIPVQFTVNTSKGKPISLGPHSTSKKVTRESKQFLLLGEGALGGFVWNSLLLLNGLENSVLTLSDTILHSVDSFEPTQVENVKQVLLRKQRTKKHNAFNHDSKNMPKE